mmetsp:Transcript_3534/g.5120  ORF Transcript_3534/g.5120 Transcript_3534/m.5120 type:complete len:407 (+) Transcript_3534:157-1377(+)
MQGDCRRMKGSAKRKREALEGDVRCKFYVKRKARTCTLRPTPGEEFCVHHKTKEKWIPCPLDPKHDVKEEELEAHLRVCNVTKQKEMLESQEYYSKGINTDKGVEEQQGPKSLADFSQDEKQELISQLDSLVEKTEGKECPDALKCAARGIAPEERSKIAKRRKRHVVQEEALIDYIRKILGEDNFKSNSCYVEMGCGKGGLSKTISDTIGEGNQGTFVLVDRGAFSNKKCRVLRDRSDRCVNRLRIDIRDLDLWKVRLVKKGIEQGSKIAIVSKHLCGVATDYTLRVVHGNCPDVVVIALCCHNQCSFDAYCNRKWLTETLGLTRRMFDCLRLMSSWALISSDDSDGDVEKRVEIGRKCKKLINLGRVNFLEQHGMVAHLVDYVSTVTTLENTLLVAYPKNKKLS